MDRTELSKAHVEAAAVLRENYDLLTKFSHGDAGKVLAHDKPQLGALIANPVEFWAAAASSNEAQGGDVKAVELAVRYAASRLAVGDFEFVRQSLIGQALWTSALAARMGQKAESTRYCPAETQYVKLALAAQRQACATLATVAALNKLQDASAVTVGDGG